MIDYTAIDINWIENVSKSNRNTDKTLVEKTIRAFVLLEGLASTGLPFVFKGGTSLMLLTKSSKRMSIDIDIIMPDVPSHLTEMLEAVVQKQGFLRVERQERHSETKVPKIHYKFYYKPIHRTANMDVLEDIFQTALCVSTRGMQGKGEFDELMAGIKRVNGFIFSESYQIDKAIVCASKAAYLSALIKKGDVEFERYSNPLQIKEWQIKQTEYSKLNKLKKSSAEAFFYWYKACAMR
ncbi:MAG: nucleotidyl transferase AbiEii/AbiGii toxin family protein [Bacteroidales bacterium]|nr:nucleotidyl transferase AbiEii/AbiGii toxin family protein [Bacteroidales bacterium]